MLFKYWTGRWRQRHRRIPALCTPQLPNRRDGPGQCARSREWTRMIAMLTLLRCDGFSVSTLLPKPGTDRGSGDRLVEEAGPAPVTARWRIGNRFPPPPLFLHEPGRFEGTQVDSSRLDGCQQTLDVERVRPQTTRRQSVTETRSNGFDSRSVPLDSPRCTHWVGCSWPLTGHELAPTAGVSSPFDTAGSLGCRSSQSRTIPATRSADLSQRGDGWQ